MAVNGRNILVMMDGKVIAGTRSHEQQTEAEDILYSSPTTGRWRRRKAGMKDWSLTVNYLVLTDEGVLDLLKVGNFYTIATQDRNGKYSISGQAMLKVCKHTYTVGNLAQGTYQFVGDGELS